MTENEDIAVVWLRKVVTVRNPSQGREACESLRRWTGENLTLNQSRINGMVVGQLTRMLRKKQSLTQAELAQRLGLTQSSLSRVERGIGRLDPVVFCKLADTFGVNIEDLRECLNESFSRAERAFRATNEGTKGDWWIEAENISGIPGIIGLIKFAVAGSMKQWLENGQG